MTCSEYHRKWGDCRQPARVGGRCFYHHRAVSSSSFRRDPFYERKIVLGLTEPTDAYITPTEVDSLFRGRPRNDGRRLDSWTK